MPHSNDINKGFTLEIPLFPNFVIPKGGLTNERASHALFYYYILAMQMYDKEKNQIVMEGDQDYEPQYVELAKSVARLYGTSVDTMVNAWASVDVTCEMHNMPKMPHGNKYRHRGWTH